MKIRTEDWMKDIQMYEDLLYRALQALERRTSTERELISEIRDVLDQDWLEALCTEEEDKILKERENNVSVPYDTIF